jgi:glycosyltransferase involved in cell wall biosynthesis
VAEVPPDEALNRQSRVVVSMRGADRFARFRLAASTAQAIGKGLLGLHHPLTCLDGSLFADFIWRSMFDKTLPSSEFDSSTGRRFRIASFPWSGAHSLALGTRYFGRALYPKLDTKGVDVMVAQTPYPGRVRRNTRLVVRYHDAVPLLMPHTISQSGFHQASHYHALRRNVADGAWFACVSDATRRDLLSIFPSVADRAVTIHNMISPHYYPESILAGGVVDIVRTRRVRGIGKETLPTWAERPVGEPGFPYLLMVSTIEPRKNHLTLLAAWERLRASGAKDLQLICVGALGWEHDAIVKKLEPWLREGSLHLLSDVPSEDLRLLYRHAVATVCPSVAEGFDYSGVEAMRSGGVVLASDIPVHREVFGDGALYFMPYSGSELAAAVAEIASPDAQPLRETLVRRGIAVSDRYQCERLLPQWQDFLSAVRANKQARST